MNFTLNIKNIARFKTSQQVIPPLNRER